MGNWCGKRTSRLADERGQQYVNPNSYDFNFEGMVQFKKSPIELDYRI